MKAKVEIPRLEDITLDQYQRFVDVQEKHKDADEFVLQKMVSIFLNLTMLQVLDIKVLHINRIAEALSDSFKEQPKFKNRFTLNGVEYGFIPNLEDISLGEFVDLETNLQDVQSLHRAMAVMYRPIENKYSDKYKIEKYEGTGKYCDVMKEAPLDVVFGAMVFFWTLANELLRASLDYLREEARVMITQHNHSLIQSGDGIIQSMRLLEEMLPSLMPLPKVDYLSASHG